jgi:hypothetical protein
MKNLNLIASTLILTLLTSAASRIHAASIPFVNFGSFYTLGAPSVGIGRHLPQAPSWYTREVRSPFPGWDENVEWQWEAQYTGPFTPTGDDPLIIAAPFTSSSTIFAKSSDGSVVGTLVLNGEGVLPASLRADTSVADPTGGQMMTRYFNSVPGVGYDRPIETYTIVGKTGIYQNLEQVGRWSLYGAGLTVRPFYAGQTIDQAALNGIITSHSTLTIEGSYEIVPEPTSMVVVLVSGIGLMRRRR